MTCSGQGADPRPVPEPTSATDTQPKIVPPPRQTARVLRWEHTWTRRPRQKSRSSVGPILGPLFRRGNVAIHQALVPGDLFSVVELVEEGPPQSQEDPA